jgi:hypothetical protein
MTSAALDQGSFFFLSDSFVFRNNPDNIVTFKINTDGVEAAKIFFSRSARCIKSLDSSPFGGFVLTQGAGENIILKLIRDIDEWCSANGVDEIRIRMLPDIYDPIGSKLVQDALCKTGYQVFLNELLQVLTIDKTSLDRFRRNRRRKLRNCAEANLQFARLSPDQIDSAYDIFVECRVNKNYPVTMSLEEFKNSFKKFPDRYFLFGVFDGNNLVAASVCIAVNGQIMYDFFHGDRLSMRKFSPLTLLVKGIIEFCQAHEFRLLDMGVSTDAHGINIGLQQFKMSFGARTYHKVTYCKRITPS